MSWYSYEWIPEVCRIKDGWSAGTMADIEIWSVLWFLCLMCVAPVKIQCQLETVYGVCVIPCKQADMVHGYQQWQDMLAPSMSTTDDAWHTDTFSCWCCQRARDSLDTAQNCPGPTGLQRSVCKLVAKNHTDDDKAYCMGLSCIHWTCYTDQRGHFWSWNMVDYTKPETR